MMKFLSAEARKALINWVAIGAAGIALYVLFPFATGREALAVLGAIAVVTGYRMAEWRDQTTNRLRQLETNVASLHAASYKIVLIIRPNWNAIIEKGLSEATNRAKLDEFLSGRKPELAGKSFRFIGFSDGVSSLKQWWSDYEKTFVDRTTIQGHLFEVPIESVLELTRKGFMDSVLMRPFVITPDQVGFDTSHAPPPGFVDRLSAIPYTEIIWFLMDLHKHMGDVVMHGIKTFPKELREKFDRHNVRYQAEGKSDFMDSKSADKFDKILNLERGEEWAKTHGVEISTNTTEFHTFTTEFYSVGVRIDFSSY